MQRVRDGLPPSRRRRKLRRRRRGLAQAQSRGRRLPVAARDPAPARPRTSCRWTTSKSPPSASAQSPRCSTGSKTGTAPAKPTWCLTVIRISCDGTRCASTDINPPLFLNMRRQSPKKQRRSRTLDDHEIRKVWAAADQSGTLRRPDQDVDPDRAEARQGPTDDVGRSDRRQDHVENPHRITA